MRRTPSVKSKLLPRKARPAIAQTTPNQIYLLTATAATAATRRAWRAARRGLEKGPTSPALRESVTMTTQAAAALIPITVQMIRRRTGPTAAWTVGHTQNPTLSVRVKRRRGRAKACAQSRAPRWKAARRTGRRLQASADLCCIRVEPKNSSPPCAETHS